MKGLFIRVIRVAEALRDAHGAMGAIRWPFFPEITGRVDIPLPQERLQAYLFAQFYGEENPLQTQTEFLKTCPLSLPQAQPNQTKQGNPYNEKDRIPLDRLSRSRLQRVRGSGGKGKQRLQNPG
jgi:hypothetical protein